MRIVERLNKVGPVLFKMAILYLRLKHAMYEA